MSLFASEVPWIWAIGVWYCTLLATVWLNGKRRRRGLTNLELPTTVVIAFVAAATAALPDLSLALTICVAALCSLAVAWVWNTMLRMVRSRQAAPTTWYKQT